MCMPCKEWASNLQSAHDSGIVVIRWIVAMLGTIMVGVSVFLFSDSEEEMSLGLFECGVDSLEKGRRHISIQFVVIAIVFIVFDLEVLYLLVLMTEVSVVVMIGGTVFMMLVVLGLAYELKTGSVR